ncbi:MAG TPA: hypothetical protein VG273_16165 [Bryobacteraceae bacterium]|jgi:hypothetical protein|nr:hypothetical protein [Bryobacteraceae bacterium]
MKGEGFRAWTFEEMSDAERREWRASLSLNGQHPAPVAYLDSELESVFEFRPNLNATIERTPNGHAFVVAFREGRLNRERELDPLAASSESEGPGIPLPFGWS